MSAETIPTNLDVVAGLDAVSKSYDGTTFAVESVSLQVAIGELAIVTGPSGSGKSTILRLLQGIEQPDTGTVEILGQPFSKMSFSQQRELIGSSVGVGFQAPMHARNYSVKDNVMLTAEGNKHTVTNRRLAQLAIAFGMEDSLFRNQKAGTLSGGQQMRVAIMRALIDKPQLILLDEPTGAIDSHGKEEAFAWIADGLRAENASAVIVTHDPEIARKHADVEFVIDGGKLVNIIRRHRQIQPINPITQLASPVKPSPARHRKPTRPIAV